MVSRAAQGNSIQQSHYHSWQAALGTLVVAQKSPFGHRAINAIHSIHLFNYAKTASVLSTEQRPVRLFMDWATLQIVSICPG